jgi:DNA-binding response OmpR family regulator
MDERAVDDKRLEGKRLLIADDEFLIALCIQETFRDAGAEVVTAATLQDALKIASDEPLSAALLDVRLGRQTTEPVADVLAARAVPFVFYSGQALPALIRAKHPDARVLMKPSQQNVFVDAMLQAMRAA